MWAIEIAEDFDAGGWVGGLEDRPCFGGREPSHELRSARGVQGRTKRAQPIHVAQLKHFAQLGKIQRVDHVDCADKVETDFGIANSVR